MQRLREDRGAVAVVLALLLVPLLGFTALGVDVAAIAAERQQLQNGADAAALAIAQDCARGSCGDPAGTAAEYAGANLSPDEATATLLDTPTPASGTVTVVNAGLREHWFAPVLGIDASTITTRATAVWGYPVGGVSNLPLTFSWCDFAAQTGGGVPSTTTERTIYFPKTSDTGCTAASGNVVPGGFAWIDTVDNRCEAATTIGTRMSSDPGNSPSTGCDPADLVALRGQSILLPVYDQYGAQGTGAWYRVYGYAAFTMTGYHFGGQYTWNSPCGGNDRCVRGYFTRFVDLDDTFDLSATAPNLGAAVVALTE